ncbi:hypothetical protein ACLKA6_011955 [Drosophila palustris]
MRILLVSEYSTAQPTATSTSLARLAGPITFPRNCSFSDKNGPVQLTILVWECSTISENRTENTPPPPPQPTHVSTVLDGVPAICPFVCPAFVLASVMVAALEQQLNEWKGY